MAIAHDDDRCRSSRSCKCLGCTIAITALRHDGNDLRHARQNTGDCLLGNGLRPLSVNGTCDLELVVICDASLDTGMNFVVDEDTGKTPDFQKVSTIGQATGQVVDLNLAHLLEIDRDAPGARFRYHAVEGNDNNTGITGFLHGAIEGRG